MEILFSNNLIILFAVASFAIISYSNFEENQRIILIYILTYVTCFFKILNFIISVSILLIIMFIYIEYLTNDVKKLQIIKKFRYKLLDFIYMAFFQYHIHFIIAALAVLSIKMTDLPLVLVYSCEAISLLLLIVGIQNAISQPFKIKTVTQICVPFEAIPIYRFIYSDQLQKRMNLLCSIEDKSYFIRKNSYNFISIEFLKYKLKRLRRTYIHSDVKNKLRKRNIFRYINRIKRFHLRGYSTLEMQLMRNLAVDRGYERYVFSRKIFELVYSRIFLNSYKEYCQSNTCLTLAHYKQYLLSIYFNVVQTRIHDIPYRPFASTFLNSQDISNWSMEGLFIACLGLSFRIADQDTISLYRSCICRFGLDEKAILKLDTQFPKVKFPLSSSARL